MRADAHGTDLTAEQQRIAAAGIKALMPVAGERTMLDLIVGNLLAAGFSEIGLVIGAEHDAIREFCAARGYNTDFAVQAEPLGTGDAVLAAEALIGRGELFAVVNSDNLYPVDDLRRMRATNSPAMIGYSRDGLIANSNIPEERIAKFATVETDGGGYLRKVVEKPDLVEAGALVSMNAWVFDETIFEACRRIELSPRGEYELTAAVQFAVDHFGSRIEVVRSDAGVLDLSSRADIAAVRGIIDNMSVPPA